MTFETVVDAKLDYEVKRGFSGSGKPVFFLYWYEQNATSSARPVEIEGLDSPYRSEGEAVANAECQVRCGTRLG